MDLSSMRTLVWFRGKDLRIEDHTPLAEAAKAGEVIPLFVLDPYFFAKERARELPRRIQFLLDSLNVLADSIARLGSELVVVRGKSTELVPKIAAQLKVDRVVGYRWTEPVGRERDRRVTKALGPIPFELHEGETLAEPGTILTQNGEPFRVFTPYARAFARAVNIDVPRRAPKSLPPLPELPKSMHRVPIPDLGELGIARVDGVVTGGETAARARLKRFLAAHASDYERSRNALGEDGTSRISQDLKFGTLSPRTVWRATQQALKDHGRAWKTYANELVWREFAYDVLFHKPDVLDEPYRAGWKGFPFRKDERAWNAWVCGTTGYPVVDAAARQLLATGFVHNRARMIAASFLCKHLLLDFRLGEAHYMKFLTDGDWAANDMGWQWSCGCGVDAQPWFRIFNPTAQAERFDSDGAYVRRWVPEYGTPSYPNPIVDHVVARNRFLSVAKSHLGSATG